MQAKFKLRSLVFFVGGVLFFLLPLFSVGAQEQETLVIHFFWSKGCPHCAAEKPFLESLVKEYPGIRLNEYEIGERENADLFIETVKELDIGRGGVFTPLVVIGDNYFVGFLDEATNGGPIRAQVEECRQGSDCPDIVGDLAREMGIVDGAKDKAKEGKKSEDKKISVPESITVPVWGAVSLGGLSLPAVTTVIGLLDGFNPCAMWALIFLISMLIGMENRRRMWLIGGTFILSSAVVYFLFLAAWLNLFLVVGFLWWVRLAVGLTALGVGYYNLREFYMSEKGVCKVVDEEGKGKMLDRFERVVQKRQLWLVLVGVAALGVAVNTIEVVCSAGLPAIYTQVLSMADLAWWKYYSYLVMYIFFYMLDDLIVFVVAMVTLRVTGLDTKYQHYSRLVGGVLMAILGLILLFRPEWLMFG